MRIEFFRHFHSDGREHGNLHLVVGFGGRRAGTRNWSREFTYLCVKEPRVRLGFNQKAGLLTDK
jgi:hypothetical protein